MLARAPRVLHIGYFLILPNLDAHALAARFRRARAGGTMTLLDVATPGRGEYLDRLRVVLPETDIFVPNTDEAELILGESDPVLQARAFRAMGARRVVITLGERGVVSLSDALEVRLGVFPVDYIDGSGGGDAFNAGYILGLLEGRSELDCLKVASAVGASCVRGRRHDPMASSPGPKPRRSSAVMRSPSRRSPESARNTGKNRGTMPNARFKHFGPLPVPVHAPALVLNNPTR